MLEKLPLKVVHEVTQGQYAVIEPLLPTSFRVDLMRKRQDRMEKLIEHKIKKKYKEYYERREKEKKGSKSKIINAVREMERYNPGAENRRRYDVDRGRATRNPGQ